MFTELISGKTNVKARFSAMTAITPRMSMLRRLPTTKVAPNNPNTAPDAPAVSALSVSR